MSLTIALFGFENYEETAIVFYCLNALKYIVEQDKDGSIIKIIYDSAVIPFVIQFLSTKESDIYRPALSIIGQISACNSSDIKAYILGLGVADKLN